MMEVCTIRFDLDASALVGKNVKDVNDRDVGRITSFLIDSSGRVDEVLVENAHGKFDNYPVEMLEIDQAGVSLISHIDRKIESLAQELPVITRKRRILDKLSENKVIPPDIYENLCKEFDKALKEMRKEAEGLLEDTEKKAEAQDEYIRTLQLSRTFLEIEREIGTIKNEVYQQSLMSILREIKNARQRKLSLIGIKDNVTGILMGEEEEPEEEPEAEPAMEPETEPELTASEEQPSSSTESEEEEVVPVRMVQE